MRLRRPTFSALRRFDGKKLIRSLSFRLMLFFVLVSGGVLGAAGYISYKETLENIDEFFDTYQMALGRLLAAADWSSVSQHTQKVTDRLIEGIENADDDDDAVGFAVFTPQGDMIFHDNENGKYIHFSDNIGSFSNEHIHDEDDPWRLVRLKSADGKYLIAVGQEIEYREDLAMDIVEEFMLPWVTGFAFLLLAIVGLTYIEFRPLKKLARQIKRRQADDLTPISTEKAPVEVLPLLKAMNHIFGKIEALLGRERSFISDSAHELRTPLTALKIQLEIAQMAKDDEQLHTQTLDKLAKGLERAEHLVEQLLALSRLEANNGHYDNQEILNWPDIIQQLIDEYTPNAAKKDIRFIRGEIGPALIRSRLPVPAEKELLVLDPPRSGTADDVIKELARRSPLRVVHVFCGTDVIPGSLAQWKSQGYQPVSIQLLDLFPGTPNLETMILLEKQ